ncbi:MAG: hypothetical protein IBJ18_03870 [Phycisphaerales bacterium]|nr:hypothetical protein [Phycisphaerales bacterium]
MSFLGDRIKDKIEDLKYRFGGGGGGGFGGGGGGGSSSNFKELLQDPSQRKKLVIAGVFGVAAVCVLLYTFVFSTPSVMPTVQASSAILEMDKLRGELFKLQEKNDRRFNRVAVDMIKKDDKEVITVFGSVSNSQNLSALKDFISKMGLAPPIEYNVKVDGQ